MATSQVAGLIGPNAILQFVPPLEQAGGPPFVAAMLARAGLTALPDGTEMIPEAQAAHLHQAVRAEIPDRAAELSADAGRRTGDYILAHRIPRPAQTLLRLMPPTLAARALSKAIARHAWTFAGSGTFTILSPWRFEIADNPIVRGEESPIPLCHWHAAAFTRLYQALVDPRCHCTETHCSAQPGQSACIFSIERPT